MAIRSSSPAACFTTKPDAPARRASAASGASACMVRKTTRQGRDSARSLRRTSSPVMPGMAMSDTMTSGRSLRATSRSASPSVTVPSSVNSSRRRPASPSATMAWSSASSTVARAMPVLREGHHQAQLGAVDKPGVDRERAADEAGALLYADEAESAAPARLRDFKAAAIIGDGQLHGRVVAGQRHANLIGARVLGHVAESLLGGAVEAQRHVAGYGARGVVGVKDHARSVRALDLVAVPAQGGDQPRLREHAGVELVREVTHAFRDVGHVPPELD